MAAQCHESYPTNLGSQFCITSFQQPLSFDYESLRLVKPLAKPAGIWLSGEDHVFANDPLLPYLDGRRVTYLTRNWF